MQAARKVRKNGNFFVLRARGKELCVMAKTFAHFHFSDLCAVLALDFHGTGCNNRSLIYYDS